jgi:type II secretory pathway component PulM
MISLPETVIAYLSGAAGVVGAVGLVICTLAFGWYVVWCTSLRDLPIAQEMMGKRRQSQAQKDQIAREIREIKRQHSRRGPSMDLVRQTSLTRQVALQACVRYSMSLGCIRSKLMH